MTHVPTTLAAPLIRLGLAVTLFVFSALAAMADATIEQFVGTYAGSADVLSADGSSSKRDMSVEIEETKAGFSVKWTSTSYKPDGRVKEKSYAIDFKPSDRDGIYAAAMKTNVFGHAVPLDPMKGEPFVWGRIVGDTMTVYSLFVDDVGGWEIQQFDRTLAEGGLTLDFMSIRNGEPQRTVTSFLKKDG